MDKKDVIEKKIYEEKVHKIITRLAIETIDEDTLISLVKYIEPYHYEEIVEERFLSKICGYPICGSELKKIPTQKYQISSKLNKVYDIGDRKRFCSAECYKSSKYLESQVSKVPIWLRNTSEYIKNDGAKTVLLLSGSRSKFKSATDSVKSYHDEYDLKFNPSLGKKLEKSEFSDIQDLVISKNQLYSSGIENELNEIENQWRNRFKMEKTTDIKKLKDPLRKHGVFKHININEQDSTELKTAVKNASESNSETIQSQENIVNKKFIESTQIHQMPTSLYHLGKIFRIVNEPIKADENPNDTLIIDENDENLLSKYFFTEYIIKRITDLVSPRTKHYIMEKKSIEESKLHEERKRLEQLKKFDEYVTETGVLFNNLTSEVSAKTMNVGEFSSKLNKVQDSMAMNALKNMDDNGEAEMIAKLEVMGINSKSGQPDVVSQEVKKDSGVDDEYAGAQKPLPDYKKLELEAKQQQLKIREFFMGNLSSEKAQKLKEIEKRELEENEMNKDPSAFNPSSFKLKDGEQEIIRVLPTVDSQFQMEIRRKIFYEKLVRYLDQLLKFSDFSTGDVQLTNHIKNLIFSLSFDNQNILFGANEWPIVALFMLKILSLKKTSKTSEATNKPNSLSSNLEKLIQSNPLIQTILSSFQLNQDKLEKICSYLMD